MNQRTEITNLFIINQPLNYTEYIQIISKIVPHFNSTNLINNERIYSVYLKVFNHIKNNNITTVKEIIKNTSLTKIGIYSLSNRQKQYWYERGYNDDEVILKMKEFHATYGIDSIIKKHNCTIEEATLIHNQRLDKRNSTFNIKTDIEIAEINYKKGSASRMSDMLTKINPVTNDYYTEAEIKLEWKKRYGWSLGKKLTDTQLLSKNTNINYYLNKGFTEEEALIALTNRQTTFSLDICIQKHGELKGYEIWKNRQDKWLNTLDNKTDEEKQEINRKKIQRPNFFSVESIIFFEKLINKINNFLPNNNFTYLYKENEYYINTNGKFYLYDFTIKELNLIIEYNGSHVHPNTNMSVIEWNNWKHVFTKENADICFQRDLHKLNCAENKGFDVIIIWDKDIKNKIINKTFKYLLNIINNKHLEINKNNKQNL